MKTQTLTIALIAAASLAPETKAADLSFMYSGYEFLDSILMMGYKPMIWYLVIAPLKSYACTTMLKTVEEMFLTNNSMT